MLSFFTDVITYFYLLLQLSEKVSTILNSVTPEQKRLCGSAFQFIVKAITFCFNILSYFIGYIAHAIINVYQMLLKILENLLFSEVSVSFKVRVSLSITFS